MAVGVFPYAAWRKLSRTELEALRRGLRALPAPSSAVRELAGALLGANAALTPLAGELVASAAAVDMASRCCALVLARTLGAEVDTIVCELELPLAANLVDRVLGGDGRAVHPPGAALDPLAAGALAYFAARLCAQAGAAFTLRALHDRADDLRRELGDTPVLVAPFEFAIEGVRAGVVRVLIPEPSVRRLALVGGPRRPPPDALQALPITLCAHAASLTLARRELEALGIGDVLVPSQCRLVRAESGFAGQLVLHALGGANLIGECAARATELVVTRLAASEELVMTEGKRIDTQTLNQDAPLLDDTPVTLCLELARFTLPLGELRELRPGEVLSTGRAIGERAQLTAGGVPIARGELVEVDGEIGLRVLELVRS